MNDEQLLRYHRHVLLDGIDVVGQQAIVGKSVLLIGAGGLGCPVALYLAAAGIGRITLVDPDVVDLGNLQRQVAYREADVGQAKVDVLQRELQARNDSLRVDAYQQDADARLLDQLLPEHDLLVDATDNFPARHLANTASVRHRRPLVSGAAIRWEGQVSVFDPRTPGSPCYACLYPQSSSEGLSCAEAGVFAPLCGLVGSLMAGEALKVLVGDAGVLCGRLLLVDQRSAQIRVLKLPPDPACRVCGRPAA